MATLYTIAGRAPWRVSAAAGAGAAVVSIVTAALWGAGSATDHGGLYGYAIGAIALYAAAIGFGLYFGAQRRVRDGLRERAERLDRERELLADRAVAEERVRIAQELHDIVAHNVSLMVVEAQALGATVPDDRGHPAHPGHRRPRAPGHDRDAHDAEAAAGRRRDPRALTATRTGPARAR